MFADALPAKVYAGRQRVFGRSRMFLIYFLSA
jgi:hypothetical protein